VAADPPGHVSKGADSQEGAAPSAERRPASGPLRAHRPMQTDASRILQRRSFQAGALIFAQGQVGTRAYVVESGEVEIVRVQGHNRRPLGKIGPGGIFGEMALIDDQPRMADAIALTACTCLVITREQFRAKLEAADPFVQGLLRIFVRNIRSMADAP